MYRLSTTSTVTRSESESAGFWTSRTKVTGFADITSSSGVGRHRLPDRWVTPHVVS